jgi:RNA polymerase sigma-70 factor (ECF subfamily)
MPFSPATPHETLIVPLVPACIDDGLDAFLAVRPRLFGIAYRMLGSTTAAEDIVQDVWLRWQATDRRLVRDPAPFLAKTATRLAINVMQSARSRREMSTESMPDPIDKTADPVAQAESTEALKLGIFVLLQKLSTTERAAYILREAFGYAYRDIARVLRLQEANARQVVTRARHRLAEGPSMAVACTEQQQLLEAFIVAARNGDLGGLEALLAERR